MDDVLYGEFPFMSPLQGLRDTEGNFKVLNLRPYFPDVRIFSPLQRMGARLRVPPKTSIWTSKGVEGLRGPHRASGSLKGWESLRES